MQQNRMDWFPRDGGVTTIQLESGNLAGSEGVHGLQLWQAVMLLNILRCLLLWSVSENSQGKGISHALLWNGPGLVPSWHLVLLVKIKYWLDFPVSNKVAIHHTTFLHLQMWSSWFHHFWLKLISLITLPVLCHSDIIFTPWRWRFLQLSLMYYLYQRWRHTVATCSWQEGSSGHL